MELILASNSPRRKELLTEYGFSFKIIPSNFEEVLKDKLTAKETVELFAKGKAEEVFNRLKSSDVVVLGSDTVVSIDGEILGKPHSREEAVKMLKRLSGKAHQVISGYAIISEKKSYFGSVTTDVYFNELSSGLIEEYVGSGLPMDKAGSYGIQDGFDLVEKWEGSFNNVVGLPIEIIQDKIKELLR